MLEFKLNQRKVGPNTFDMSMPQFRIVFMGTPEFAVSSLHALREAGISIAAVVTAPDKPAGRGMKLTQSAVKKYAVDHNLPVLQPEKLKDAAFVDALRSLQANLHVVVAFRMLPEVVWSMPPLGTVNLHGSLLPQYRGAAPINWAVINGEEKTGVTTFRLQHAIDTGNILLQESMPIGENETAGEVHDRMKEIGARLLVQTVVGLQQGTLTETPQSSIDAGALRHAPKIFSETAAINFHQSTAAVHNLIRGLSPFPGAFTQLQGKMLKIFRSEKEITKPTFAAGEYVTDNKTYLKFACTDGCVSVKELQLEGKKRMGVEEFLRGLRAG